MCGCPCNPVERRGRAINRRASAGARLVEARTRLKDARTPEGHARAVAEVTLAESAYNEAREVETMALIRVKEAEGR